MNDPQQHAVYAMEAEEFASHCNHTLPLLTLKKWARQTCRLFKVPSVTIRVYAIRGRGGGYTEGRIQLDPSCGRNALTLFHELAHHIVRSKHPRAQDHGPLFCAYYAWLLDAWRLMPRAGFRAAARRHGVKVAKRLLA
jgi:hypothetical protein